MKDVIIATILICAGLIALVLIPAYLIGKYTSCPHFAEATGLPTKYDFWAGGCFVQLEGGQWVLTENYQGITGVPNK